MPTCVCCSQKATHTYLQYPVCHDCYQHQQLANLIDQGISYDDAMNLLRKKKTFMNRETIHLPPLNINHHAH